MTVTVTGTTEITIETIPVTAETTTTDAPDPTPAIAMTNTTTTEIAMRRDIRMIGIEKRTTDIVTMTNVGRGLDTRTVMTMTDTVNAEGSMMIENGLRLLTIGIIGSRTSKRLLLHSLQGYYPLALYLLTCRDPSPQLTEEERDQRTIFVQQLAARLRTKELIKFFEKAGPVREAQIVKDRISGRSKG